MTGSGARSGPAGRGVDRLWLCVAVGAAVVHAGSTLWRPAGWGLLFDFWVYTLVFAAAGVVCVRAAGADPGDRVAWWLLGSALVVYCLGNAYSSLVIGDMAEPPFPSPADWLWLTFFPLSYAAMLCLLRSRVRHFHASVWLDGLVGVLGAIAVVDAFALNRVLAVTGGPWATVVTNLAYPVGDLLLLSVVVAGGGLIGPGPGATWWLLAAGFGAFVVADSVYVVQVSAGTYVEGRPADALWTLAGALLAWAAWRRDRPGAAKGRVGQGWVVMAQPAFFAAAALALLVYGQYRPLPHLAGVVAAACLLVSGARAALTFRELRALTQARHEAATDELTGLPNRRQLLRTLDGHLLNRAGKDRLALLLIDLDHFKEINDALGHHVGDELLTLIGPRARACLRPGDVLARLGGDEFAVILPDVADQQAAQTIARRLGDALREPFVLPHLSLHIDASIGIALFPEHATDSSGLLQRADVAMYQAKAARGGHQVFHPDDHHSIERLRTIQDLRTALEQGQLLVHYQPKVNLGTGRVVGAEALVRWNHPDRGLLAPDAFLPLAERSGLIRALTHRVLDLAIRQVRVWRDQGLALSVAVNLSTSNLLDRDLPDWITQHLALHQVPAECLELEITESTLMADPHRATQVLDRLAHLGVRVSIDDYGTGYSSLAYLQRLEVTELKIDRCFIQDMTSPRTAAIVRSTIDLAHALGLTIVAEGVENTDIIEQLTSYGCDLAQGYQYAPPLPPDQFHNWLSRHHDDSHDSHDGRCTSQQPTAR